MPEKLRDFEYTTDALTPIGLESEIMTFCGATSVNTSNIQPLSDGHVSRATIHLSNGTAECKAAPLKTDSGYNVKVTDIVFTRSHR